MFEIQFDFKYMFRKTLIVCRVLFCVVTTLDIFTRFYFPVCHILLMKIITRDDFIFAPKCSREFTKKLTQCHILLMKIVTRDDFIFAPKCSREFTKKLTQKLSPGEYKVFYSY